MEKSDASCQEHSDSKYLFLFDIKTPRSGALTGGRMLPDFPESGPRRFEKLGPPKSRPIEQPRITVWRITRTLLRDNDHLEYTSACGRLKSDLRWGRGAVGSAPRWHRGGRGFESHRLHQLCFFFSTSYNNFQGALRGTKPLLGLTPCAQPSRALCVCLRPWLCRIHSSWCECRRGA